ncbi:MAG TPA: RagB/SusD family nutrient uptake outer membrane protein [Niabella sp.]|nr:RagB/SusD family nutrient uptake outer membrane protein [Niabella sp.]
MKILFAPIYIFFLLATVTSCKKYLDAVPYSFTSPDNFYKTPKDAELALTGVYSVLSATSIQGTGNKSTYSRALLCMLNGATDETVARNGFSNTDFVVWGNASFNSESKLVNETWFFFYAGINRANYLIEKIEAINGFSGNRKNEIIAEARLLRGFYHMMLSMMHGGIPVYTTSVQDPSKARQPIQDVYTQVIADYDFAYHNLPHRAQLESRVNKWTAAGLLAKVYTYLASAKKTGLNNFGLDINSFDWVDADDLYGKSLMLTTDIITKGGYELIPRYDYLFRENTKSFQYKECLLTAEASTDPRSILTHLVNVGFTPSGGQNTVGGGQGNWRPAGELFYKYVAGDARFKHNLTGNIPNNAAAETIEGSRYYIPNTINNPTQNTYSIGKYRVIDPAEKTIGLGSVSTSLPILRYGDVLLLHAEAQFFSGNEPDARATLEKLRLRALNTGSSINTLTNAYRKADFVQELLDERARELCFENWRRIDLARFNKYDETIANLSTTLGFYNSIVPEIQRNWKPERVWFPIPLPQMDLNTNLVQNPGF